MVCRYLTAKPNRQNHRDFVIFFILFLIFFRQELERKKLPVLVPDWCSFGVESHFILFALTFQGKRAGTAWAQEERTKTQTPHHKGSVVAFLSNVTLTVSSFERTSV